MKGCIMALNIKDLKEHEANLIQTINHAEEELNAVRLLIKAMLRQDHKESVDNIVPENESLIDAVFSIIQDRKEKWFTAQDMMKAVSGRNISVNPKHLRPSVGTALKRLYENDRLERKNVGSETKVKYAYRYKEQDQ